MTNSGPDAVEPFVQASPDTVTVLCPSCKQVNTLDNSARRYTCASCHKAWHFARCMGRCQKAVEVDESWSTWKCLTCNTEQPAFWRDLWRGQLSETVWKNVYYVGGHLGERPSAEGSFRYDSKGFKFESRYRVFSPIASPGFKLWGSWPSIRSMTYYATHNARITGTRLLAFGVLAVGAPKGSGSCRVEFVDGKGHIDFVLSGYLSEARHEQLRTLKEIITWQAKIPNATITGAEFKRTLSGSTSAPRSPLDLVRQLKQLAELHAAGALDDKEFAAAKLRLLGPTDGDVR